MTGAQERISAPSLLFIGEEAQEAAERVARDMTRAATQGQIFAAVAREAGGWIVEELDAAGDFVRYV